MIYPPHSQLVEEAAKQEALRQQQSQSELPTADSGGGSGAVARDTAGASNQPPTASRLTTAAFTATTKPEPSRDGRFIIKFGKSRNLDYY